MVFKKQFNLVTKAISFVLLSSFLFTNVFIMQTFANNSYKDSVKVSMLKKYATDLTELARGSAIRPTGSYESEVNRLIKVLASGDFRQPVVVDEKGDAQELVVESLALRIAAGDAPANLKTKRILKLELDSLFSNSKTNAEASQILAAIVSELADSKGEVILFVDELTNFVGSKQINDALTNALLQEKIQIIGGSSQTAYRETIENKAELAALFQPIPVGVTSDINAEELEQSNLAENEGFRGDNVSPDLREMMAQDSTGKKRVDVIIQSKDADSAVLREIMKENRVRLEDRIGDSNTMVVNLPLSAIERLAQSGTINYMSPDREVKLFGHIENTTSTLR